MLGHAFVLTYNTDDTQIPPQTPQTCFFKNFSDFFMEDRIFSAYAHYWEFVFNSIVISPQFAFLTTCLWEA